MGIINEKKLENQKMIILKSMCKKYLWDLSYPVRVECSNFINLLDKKIIDNRNFIKEYMEKEDKKRKQYSIYDYKD